MTRLVTYLCLLVFLFVGCGITPSIEKATAPLLFEPVIVEKEIVPLKKDDIHKIIREFWEPDAKIFIFTKSKEDFRLFGGIQIKDTLYELGDVGEYTYLDQLDMKTSSLFQQPVTEIGGFCGADCAFRYYVAIKDNTPSILLYLNAIPHVIDVDQDGTEEIIASYGSPGAYETVMYTFLDNQVVSVDLNKQLNAKNVLYTDSVFQVQKKSEDPPQKYKYGKESLILSD
ncbi:hypothetical protein [Brevibacillus sp. NRS-1366]|uniref:hypothetical protein n=1 Tax=Brevibacillus sp. NRS-1366 TaxID=3233899 RepID=UPI003D1BAE07